MNPLLPLALFLFPSMALLGADNSYTHHCSEALGGHPLGHPQISKAQACAYRKCFSIANYGDIFDWGPKCGRRTLRRHTAQGGGFLNAVTKTLNAGWQGVRSALPSISIRDIQRQGVLRAARSRVLEERRKRKNESHPLRVNTHKGDFSLGSHTFPEALEKAIVGASLVDDFALTTLAGGRREYLVAQGTIPSTSTHSGDFFVSFDLKGFYGGHFNATMGGFHCYGQFLPENASGPSAEQVQLDCFLGEGTPSEVAITHMVFSLEELGITFQEESSIDDSERRNADLPSALAPGGSDEASRKHSSEATGR